MYNIQMIDDGAKRYLSYESELIPKSGEFIQLGDETFRVDYVYYTTTQYKDSKFPGELVEEHEAHYDVLLYGKVVTDLPF